MYSILSFKHQLSRARQPKELVLQLCSKCGHETAQGNHHCPKCNNHMTVHS